MWTFIGALAGAGAVVVLGRATKGRDFIGVAAGLFALALVVGLVLALPMALAEGAIAAEGDTRNLGAATAVTSALLTFAVAFLPGAVLVLLAQPAAKPKQ